MNMLVKDRAHVASERTRVFASDLVAIARVHQSLEFVLGKSKLDTQSAVKLAKLALDCQSLLDCGVSPRLILALTAVGLGSDDRLDDALNALNALILEERGLSDAQRVWSERLPASPSVLTSSNVIALADRR